MNEKLTAKFDLSKTGLEALFKQYQQIMLNFCWAFASEERPAGTLRIMQAVNEMLPAPKSISRASVINSAQSFAAQGIWGFKTTTGKGGHRRLYYPAETEAEFWGRVAEATKQGINESAGKQIL